MQFGQIQVIGLFTMGGQEVEQEVVLACVKDIIGELSSKINIFNPISFNRFCESMLFSACVRYVAVKSGQIIRDYFILLFSDTIDEDGDGNITKEEFVKNATKSDFIKSLVNDDDEAT